MDKRSKWLFAIVVLIFISLIGSSLREGKLRAEREKAMRENYAEIGIKNPESRTCWEWDVASYEHKKSIRQINPVMADWCTSTFLDRMAGKAK